MTKSKDRSELETLRALNRKQKKIIKELQKKAARGQKAKEVYEDLELELSEKYIEEEENSFRTVPLIEVDGSCPKCPKGILEQIELGVKKMILCSNCDYRVVSK